MTALGMLATSAGAAEPARRSRPGRDEAFRMVVAYLLSNLQERLGLTDEEYLRVLPLVQQRQNHRREMFEGREEALGRLRMLVRRGESPLSRLLSLRAVSAPAVHPPSFPGQEH